jgi:hypothetical protein
MKGDPAGARTSAARQREAGNAAQSIATASSQNRSEKRSFRAPGLAKPRGDLAAERCAAPWADSQQPAGEPGSATNGRADSAAAL